MEWTRVARTRVIGVRIDIQHEVMQGFNDAEQPRGSGKEKAAILRQGYPLQRPTMAGNRKECARRY